MRFLLASASPRRKMLLEEAGYEVTVQPAHIPELTHHPKGPAALAVTNACLKAEAVYQKVFLTEQEILLAADTVVCLEGEVFGKPRDRTEAVYMLSRLAGRWHEVITGVCLLKKGPPASKIEFSETTRVLLYPLDLCGIQSYLDTMDPYDKAGAYAAQDEGEHIIAQREGSFSNIVGLPMEALAKCL